MSAIVAFSAGQAFYAPLRPLNTTAGSTSGRKRDARGSQLSHHAPLRAFAAHTLLRALAAYPISAASGLPGHQRSAA
ncbi:hypothetical protein IM53_009760 [Xanthomonas phaseoli pv. dieffenbachiae]|uniref:Uncharacterized protein n=1 Tax=Xanthomonas phaseoli pv. dieffenbachiae TaxID=92828 RepID=A0A1V9H9K8_9XANT|nr:hypothetical protein IM53_009760 [Xanthomonas phaseoli pv. dieffenbachiae]